MWGADIDMLKFIGALFFMPVRKKIFFERQFGFINFVATTIFPVHPAMSSQNKPIGSLLFP